MKFNDICELKDYVPAFNEMCKYVEASRENFNDIYCRFKKEHGLNNQYFSILVHIDYTNEIYFEVWYSVSDLFLTYLKINDILPESIPLVRHTINQYYFYNDEEYQVFQKAIMAALHQQVEPEIICGKKLYPLSAYVGLTEKILLSDTGSVDSGIIIGRTPITYKDLNNFSTL